MISLDSLRKISLVVLVLIIGVTTVIAQTIPSGAIDKHMDKIKAELVNLEVPSDANKIGVLPIVGDSNSAALDQLEIVFRKSGKFQIIARDQLQTLINEIEFQEGAEIDGKTAKELKLKGVDYLVTGSVSAASEGAGTKVVLTIKMTNCSTGNRRYGYSDDVLISLDDSLGRYTKTMGPATIIIIGFVLLLIIVIIFRFFRGAKAVVGGTIFSTVKDYLLSDKKIRESTALELKQIKSKVKDIAVKADESDKGDIASAANSVAGEIDVLAQKVNGAPFGQDVKKGRAIPRDVADRLKAADLAFTDRVNDLRSHASRACELATEKRFDGLDSDVTKLKTETAALLEKFEERGRILRSF